MNRFISALEIATGSLPGDELLDTRERVLSDDVLETSANEGAILRRSSVRASIRKRLGLPVDQDDPERHADALAAILLDAKEGTDSPLTEQKLFAWHAGLFPAGCFEAGEFTRLRMTSTTVTLHPSFTGNAR